MGAEWTRRAVGAAGVGLVAAAAMSAKAAADPLSGAALYADVRTYAGFGDHRTGTTGDAAVTAWLERELRSAGYAVERQGFDYPVFELAAATVTVGPAKIPAFPLWTPAAGQVSGTFTTEPTRGAIAVLRFPFGTGHALEVSQAWRGPIQAALDAGASGVVAITENPLGELVAFNCAPNMPAWPVAVVAVAARDAATVLAGAAGGIAIQGVTRPGRAENVIARRPGAGKPLIVSTPKSGWFECAGERGSGIAIWLGLARRLAASDRNLVFMAASGHEFDGYGGHLFAEHLAPQPAEARGWVHIGANVASYDFGLVDGKITRLDHPQASRLAAASEALLAVARKAFAGQPKYEDPTDIDRERAPGEIAEYQRRGYGPLFSLVGSHVLHHTRRDLPDVTSPQVLEPVARGLAAVVEAI